MNENKLSPKRIQSSKSKCNKATTLGSSVKGEEKIEEPETVNMGAK